MADYAPPPVMPEVRESLPDAPPDNTPPTIIDQYKANHPELGDTSDYTLARNLYQSGVAQPKESFPAFATRIGVSQPPLATAANSGLTTASMGLEPPIEAGLSGLGSLMSGDGFSKGYKDKRQQVQDQLDVGAYQNPLSSTAGDIGGGLADYLRFGPGIKQAAEAIPGAKALLSNPVADSVIKMFGLGSAAEIPKAIEQQATNPNGPDIGQGAWDVLKQGLEGGTAGLAGSVASKTLGSLAAPLLKVLGGGMVAADDVAQGIPRTIYTKAAAKGSSGFTGSTTPVDAGLALDKNFYSNLLDHSSLNVSKGVAQLSDLMDQPGMTVPLVQAMKSAAPGSFSTDGGYVRPALRTYMDGVTNADTGADGSQISHLFDPVLENLAEGGDNQDAKDALKQTIIRLTNNDPTGNSVKDFVASVFKDIIPQRLAGPLDPNTAFNRPTSAGTATIEKGRLISPPIPWTDIPSKLSQNLYERSGGGPGMVMRPNITAGLGGNLKGLASVAGQVPMLALRLGGYGLQAAGSAADAAAEPGTALANMMPGNSGAYIKDALDRTPNAYQSTLFGATQSPNSSDPNAPMFPDTYHAPSIHTALPPGTDLTAVDRPTAVSHIAATLGPQVASQVPQDDIGFRAALSNLYSNPASRKALAGSDQ